MGNIYALPILRLVVDSNESKQHLGWYDTTTNETAAIAGAFHVLGQEILAACGDNAALADKAFGCIARLVAARDNFILAMTHEDLPEMTEPTYLGDGVYASFDGWKIRLDANSPKTPSDTIYIDSITWDALLDYGNKMFFDIDTKKLNSESLYGNCSVCGLSIANDEDVHDDYDGRDCHAACCPVCKDEADNG
jgi:hypothetical protein